MAAIAVTTANRIEVVESRRQLTAIAHEAMLAGAPGRLDPTTGKARNGNATDMTEGSIYGLATKTVAAGEPVTLIAEGILDGYTFTQDFNAPIYLSDTDATLADAAGTKAILVGRIVPGNAGVVGATAEKLLDVNIAHHAIVS